MEHSNGSLRNILSWTSPTVLKNIGDWTLCSFLARKVPTHEVVGRKESKETFTFLIWSIEGIDNFLGNRNRFAFNISSSNSSAASTNTVTALSGKLLRLNAPSVPRWEQELNLANASYLGEMFQQAVSNRMIKCSVSLSSRKIHGITAADVFLTNHAAGELNSNWTSWTVLQGKNTATPARRYGNQWRTPPLCPVQKSKPSKWPWLSLAASSCAGHLTSLFTSFTFGVSTQWWYRRQCTRSRKPWPCSTPPWTQFCTAAST